MTKSAADLLEALPAYIHLDDEPNRLYFILTRDINGKWAAGYWTENRYYYTATRDTVSEVLEALQTNLKNGVEND